MRLLALFLLSISVGAQTPKPEFEVASIKPLPEGALQPGLTYICRGGPATSDPALFTCPQVPLKRLILLAYNLPEFQVSAPDWTEKQRFELKTAVPPGATKEESRRCCKTCSSIASSSRSIASQKIRPDMS